MALRLLVLFGILSALRWKCVTGFVPRRGFVRVAGVTSQLGLSASPERYLELTRAQLQIPAKTKLIPLRWRGKASLPTSAAAGLNSQGGFGLLISNGNQTCLVLDVDDDFESDKDKQTSTAALLVPLQGNSLLRPLQAAQQRQVLSATQLWRLNALLVNRDDGLFDNIPFSTWTVDPLQRNMDAAGNPINALYHMGKRDAYNVLLGKDWEWKQALLVTGDNKSEVDNRTDEEDDELVLARRLFELQRREAQMDLAECDYQLAVAQTMDETWALEDQRQLLVDRLDALQSQWNELIKSRSTRKRDGTASSQARSSWIQRVIDQWENRPQAPYRGATGYATRRRNDDDKNDFTFTSPFDMMREILKDQLKAKVIGTVLENTSLLQGTTALGGVLVLQRISAQISSTIAGETLSVTDETEDYGNPGIVGGETILVECDAEEALGMSLACEVPLHIPNDILERCSVMVKAKQTMETSDTLYEWQTVDPELSVLIEGQPGNQSATERVLPLRSPRGATPLFDSILQPSTATSNELFPTDNPIQSLTQLDQLSNEEKARTLLSISNFNGQLPRPRAVQESEQGTGSMNALDRLLLPLIDESVRREYYIRQAVQDGDLELAQELESSKSMRQIAKEKLEQARMAGDLEVAAFWQNEVDLYGSLRADVTQDEGSYSRFLDRDEWYERERRKTASRVDRKKFGNLLDGIE